uniref:Putative secreted protein n=1 Tax=Anopheles darlingi TaxID=43151 RepID=A0A2M4D444_ANODA
MRPFLSVVSVASSCHSPAGGSRMMWMSTRSPASVITSSGPYMKRATSRCGSPSRTITSFARWLAATFFSFTEVRFLFHFSRGWLGRNADTPSLSWPPAPARSSKRPICCSRNATTSLDSQ